MIFGSPVWGLGLRLLEDRGGQPGVAVGDGLGHQPQRDDDTLAGLADGGEPRQVSRSTARFIAACNVSRSGTSALSRSIPSSASSGASSRIVGEPRFQLDLRWPGRRFGATPTHVRRAPILAGARPGERPVLPTRRVPVPPRLPADRRQASLYRRRDGPHARTLRCRSPILTRTSSVRNLGETSRRRVLVTGGWCSRRSPLPVIVRPCRHRFPVLGFTPTIRHACALGTAPRSAARALPLRGLRRPARPTMPPSPTPRNLGCCDDHWNPPSNSGASSDRTSEDHEQTRGKCAV
jgi:hypothetical protein